MKGLLTHGAAFAEQVGLGVAVDEALQLGVDWIWSRISALASLLRSLLAGAYLPTLTVSSHRLELEERFTG